MSLVEINSNLKVVLPLENNIKNVTLETLQSIFNSSFDSELNKFKESDKNSLEARIVKNCKSGFTRCSVTKSNKNLPINRINFLLTVDGDDYKANKKNLESKDIGFFNFIVTEHTLSEKKFFISYFSEIQIEPKYQSLGLFSMIFNTYTQTLKELNIDLDYLHVKSQMTFTASLYKKKGYDFTPETHSLLSKSYSGVDEYLKDSSVSYKNAENIEMYRKLNQRPCQIKESIESLKKDLDTA